VSQAPSAARGLRGHVARGLDMLMMPGDLRRVQSGPVGYNEPPTAMEADGYSSVPQALLSEYGTAETVTPAVPSSPAEGAGQEETQRRSWTVTDAQQSPAQDDATASQGATAQSMNYTTDAWDDASFDSPPASATTQGTQGEMGDTQKFDAIGESGSDASPTGELGGTQKFDATGESGADARLTGELGGTQKSDATARSGGDASLTGDASQQDEPQ